jgi:8-oxo-dGTP diphosphatase
MSGSVISCVGAVILDGQGRLLLIKRGHAPGVGLWSLPGGRVEPGETDHEAVVREVAEETGLRVRPGRLVGRVSRAAPSGGVYDIADYACEVAGEDALRPGTDADDARWVTAADYAGLPLVYGMTEALTEWDQLPRA